MNYRKMFFLTNDGRMKMSLKQEVYTRSQRITMVTSRRQQKAK